MNIKSVMIAALVLSGGFAITGCERGPTEREIQCMELTGDRLCRNEYEQQADADRRGMNRVNRMDYGPAGPGEYTNYYGNPQYGSWGDDGRYHFNDPYGQQASQTNAFLLGAGMGGLAAYALTRNQFKKQNPSGWTETKRTNKTYISKSGKPINKAEFEKRKKQSDADKAKHKATKKSTEQLKKKQANTNAQKSKVKPTNQQTADLKAKLKAKQQRRADKKARGATSSGSKMKANEQKVKTKKQPKVRKNSYKQTKSSSRSRSSSRTRSRSKR